MTGTGAAPSIQSRLQRALVLWALLWSAALGLSVWLAVREEVNELLDDTLQSAAEGLIAPLAKAALLDGHGGAARTLLPSTPAASAVAADGRRFIWQQVQYGADAAVLHRSPGAPAQALRPAPTSGYFNVPGWRVFGLSPGLDGQMVYVAQTRLERDEAIAEVGVTVLLAGLPMALLGLLWLGARLRRELAPLQALAQGLAALDPLRPGATLGRATHAELQPVHDAIDALTARLLRLVDRERAFSAHAAHALRTPLAGIDAQLAVALREAPEPVRPRLQRVRAAAERLQRVVAGLLTLFRSGNEVRPLPLALHTLVERLYVEGLALKVEAPGTVKVDADLLTAALLNLFDNAQRHGATTVGLSVPAPQVLRLQDDGRGCTPEQLALLRSALEEQDYAGRTGLGLMLADLVARAHGGRLLLPDTDRGFAAELHLGAASANS